MPYRARSPFTAVTSALLLSVLAFAPVASAQSDEAERLTEATRVLDEILTAPDGGLPKSIAGKAAGIVVFPTVIKGGIIVAGQRGKGVFSVRDPKTGTWSAPAFLTLTGGSIGAQIGGSATDLVLVVLNQRGVESLSSNNFKIGGEASVAAGPVGREAEAATDAKTFRAEILSYSRSRGLFAGVSLKGTTIRADRDGNERFYGTAYRTKQIVIDRLGGAPEPVAAWRAELDKLGR